MNGDQVGGIVRTLLAVGAGVLINKGLVDAGTAASISGALVTIATAAWSFYTNRPGKTIPPKAVS